MRSAWLISRAWRPGSESPISPSISPAGVSAATESTTSTSIAPERNQRVADLERLLARIRLGDEEVFEIDTELAGIDRSSACSASTKAQMPPFFWASATVVQASVVLPELSGP